LERGHVRANKYLAAVALLAVLAVVFGLAGTSAPMSELVAPRQSSSSSSDSVAHFVNPPTFDSSWLDITDKAGQYFNVTHNLNSTDVIVDITGKTTEDGRTHQKHLGGTDFVGGWNKTYGGTDNEGVWGSGLIQTADGGYAMAGYTYSFGAGGSDVWLVKTDAKGNMQWNKTYGGTNDDTYSVSLVQTDDGGYAIATSTLSFGAGGYDFWLVKTDSSGVMQWNQTYGGASAEYAFSVVQTVDGGYAIAGATLSFGAGADDFWLVKTDAAGSMQWNKTYGGTNDDTARSMILTSDGGYAIAGQTYSFGAGDVDFWLVKTNATGNKEWDKTYGTVWGETAYSLIQNVDRGYALAGSIHYGNSYAKDMWLVKTNETGNMLWNRAYGGSGHEEAASVVQTGDGRYTLVGYTTSHWTLPHDAWLIRTDTSGNMVWNKLHGGTGSDSGYLLVLTADGGYAIAGATLSFGAGAGDFWLIKTDAAGNTLDGFKYGLAWTDSTADNITLFRGTADTYWNYVRVRIWTIEEPTWMFGDINQDGIVDAQDLAILSRNYGKTFSLLSLTGIIAVAGIHTYKKRKRPK